MRADLRAPVTRGETLVYVVVVLAAVVVGTWAVTAHFSKQREQDSIARARTAYSNALQQRAGTLAGCLSAVEQRAADVQRDVDTHDAWRRAARARRAAGTPLDIETADAYSDTSRRANQRARAAMGPTIYYDYRRARVTSSDLIPYLVAAAARLHVGGLLTNCQARYPVPAKPKGVT